MYMTMDKTCKSCGDVKGVADFYRHPKAADGLDSSCKECRKEKVRLNRENNAAYYQEYDAFRFKNDPRVRARHKRYSKTQAGKDSLERSRKNWVSKNSDKAAAHIIVNNAVKSGRIKKPESCSVCNYSGRIEGHHTDYTKPLDVVWLCRKCHVEAHRMAAK